MGMLDIFKSKAPQKVGRRSYYGANTGRLFADFISSSRSADSEIRPSLRILRDRCREISRNHPYARRYLQIMATNVVGDTGVQMQVRKRNDDGTLDTVGNRIIERAFAAWGRPGFCTADRKLSWIQAQRLFIETLARDGEVLIKKIKNPRDNPFGFTLQFIEADYLDEEYDQRVEGGEIRMGVEIEKGTGRPIAYHLFEDHPHHDHAYGLHTKRAHVRVPADEIIHCFIQDRPGQTRGVCRWHPRRSSRCSTAIRSRAAQRPAPQRRRWIFHSPRRRFVGDDYDAQAPIMEAEPGTFTQLPAGMSFEAFDPAHPTTAFAEFEKAILRSISSGLGVSYVSLSNNLEGVSYSSIRQGTLEDRDHFKMMQNFMIDHFIDHVYRAWLEMAMTVGRINLPMTKYDLFADQVIYRPRGFNWVDPQKEITANVLALNNGIVSLQDIHAHYGRDTEDVFEQIDRERELADRYSIETAFQPFGAKFPAEPTIDRGEPDGDV